MIELLYERIEMHKDKFVSKIILSELQSLEVDKKGKVQAIYPNHDDQVFAYLHAIRVWYDGENLAERYGIKKNTIRTDEDIEIEQSALEQSQTLASLDLDTATKDVNDDEAGTIEQMVFIADASKFKLNNDFRSAIHDKELSQFNIFLSTNAEARRVYNEKYHVDNDSAQNTVSTIPIPDNLFGAANSDEEEDYAQEQLELHGNLYGEFMKL